MSVWSKYLTPTPPVRNFIQTFVLVKVKDHYYPEWCLSIGSKIGIVHRFMYVELCFNIHLFILQWFTTAFYANIVGSLNCSENKAK
jgi:hypothetical protein